MIIACIGFILFIGLLLFQKMHRNYLTGTGAPKCHNPPRKICVVGFPESLLFLNFKLHVSQTPHPPSQQVLQRSLQWWRSQIQQGKMGQPKQSKQRAKKAAERSSKSFGWFLFRCEEKILQQSTKTFASNTWMNIYSGYSPLKWLKHSHCWRKYLNNFCLISSCKSISNKPWICISPKNLNCMKLILQRPFDLFFLVVFTYFTICV